jgi:hypothetical protein
MDVDKSFGKCWPLPARSGMSRRPEQKYLLHNWSHRRYRDRPQITRAVLSVRLASCRSER